MLIHSQNLWYIQNVVESVLTNTAFSFIKQNNLPLDSTFRWNVDGNEMTSKDLSELVSEQEKAERINTETAISLADLTDKIQSRINQYKLVIL